MTMAINCLHRILKETEDLFSCVRKDVQNEEVRWTSISQHGSDYEKFHGVFNKLSLAAQRTLESMVNSNEPDDLRAALSTFRFQVFWNKIQKADDECIHCAFPADAQPVLKELHQLEDPTATFFLRLLIIHRIHRYRLFWPEITDRLHELHTNVQSKCVTLLRHLNLYDCIPSISQKHTLYYPEEIVEQWALMGDVVNNNQLDCLGRNQLHHVIDKGADLHPFSRMFQPTKVQDTLKSHQDNFNKPDIFGRTPLHAACHKMSLDTVKTFLKFGADVSRMTVFGSRPLHYAAARGSDDICKALLDTNVIDTNALDGHGCTALAYAVKKEHIDVVKLLLSEKLRNKADPNVSGTRCQPPLMDAIQQGNEGIVQLLLDAGADPGFKFYGSNAFHFATSLGNLQMMALLAEKIPEHLLYTKNAWGHTPLIMAVYAKFTRGVSLISGFTGVDLNARDERGCTPLMLAAGAGQYGMVVELLKHIVDTSAVDVRGRTAADRAREEGHSLTADLIECCYEEVENATGDRNGSDEREQRNGSKMSI
jgi:ankyrin repeat protein